MRNKFLKVGITTMALCLSQQVFADGVYTIYPIPQQQVQMDGTAKLTQKVNVIFENGIDEATRNRLINLLKKHQIEVVVAEKPSEANSNIYLGINGSEGTADKMATTLNLKRDVFQKKDKFDRHLVSLAQQNGIAQLVILGEHTDATFFGIASFEQILDNDLKALPCVAIYDYADQKSRGLVEGYYGYPYTVQVKKDLMNYMMRFKMNTYLYGAKSDPYHSHYWKEPYPTTLTAQQEKNGWLSQDMIKDITDVSHETKVNFIWAIHPGNDIMHSPTVVKDVTTKFDKMYQLGVRQFAVFVDDVGVPNSDTDMSNNARNISNIQKELEKKYNTDYKLATDTVKPIHFVPQVYCSSWVGEAQRKRFFKSLSSIPTNITVYTTGWGVWSVPNQGDFNLTASELGRPAAWWWNYPCNDNADAQVYPMDMYSNFFDMPAVNDNAKMPKELSNGLGIVCNPMQQGEISKIPLFSVADYAWNTSGFDNLKSWNASFPTIVGKDKAAAYQLVARYLRWNDPDQLNVLINKYKNSLKKGTPEITELKKTLDELYAACLVIEGLKDSETESDRLLYTDLSPWLLKLKQMAQSSSALLVASTEKDGSEEKWNKYVNEIQPIAALDTAEMYKAYALEGMGNSVSESVRQAATAHRYLYPFTKFLQDNALGAYFEPVVKEMTLISNVKDLKGEVVLRNDSVGLKTATYNLKSGEYVGFSLPNPRLLADIVVVDTLTDKHQVLYSANGKDWKRFGDKATLLESYVKYICVKNEQASSVSLQLPLSALSVILGEPTRIDHVTLPNGPIWNEGGYHHTGDLMIDGDYNTYTCLYRCQLASDKYMVELNKVTPIHDVRICMGITNGDHMNSGYVEVSKDGKAWKKIVVKGTSSFDFTINIPQAVKYSKDMTYCDFDGKGFEGKYVRFCLKSPRTDKWLRFYEMEVNKQFENGVESATIPNGKIWENHNKEYMYDGNYSTFVCLNKNQAHGDAYTLKLRQPTKVNEVRICMGTTNGDHMNKGNVEVSVNGRQWTKLYVKGTKTYDFTMDMPQTVKYSNEVYYCDFTAAGTPVQYVRFVDKEARTNKWLRLYEIEINPNDKRELDVCQANDGSPITTLDDAKGNSGINSVDQSLTYFFNSINLIKSVTIYQDASVSAAHPATIQVTSDGNTWNDCGTLSQNKQVIDLSQQSDATAMKISWGGKQSPAIYEIVASYDDNNFAEVTKVEQVSTTEEKVEFSFNGKVIKATSNKGITAVEMFTLDGKSVMSYQAAGMNDVQVPTICQRQQTYIIRVCLSNGEKVSYKVFCK